MPPRADQRRSRKGLAISLAALTLLVGTGAAWWMLRPSPEAESADPAAAARAPIIVRVTNPRSEQLLRKVRATGTLFANEQTTIAAKVSGRVIEVHRDLGDQVRPGEILLRIDPVDYELARDERARAVEQALARLGLTELPGPDFEIDAVPSVERARLQFENAKARFERGRLLADRTPPLISEQDFADLRTTREVAESDLKLERLAAESTLAEARRLVSQLRIAEQELNDTTHRAPAQPLTVAAASAVDPMLHYQLAERMVSVGDFVQVGAPLFKLVDSDPIKLRVQIPERRIGAVRIGQRVAVQIEAYREPFEGHVTRLSPIVDPATRAFIAEVSLPNADGRLRPGSFAVANIDVGEEPATVLPATSVLTFAGVHKVAIVKEGRIEERRVQLGERQDDQIEILSGVTPADVVVLTPSASLTTGTPVTVDPVAKEQQ